VSITLGGYTFPGASTHQVPDKAEWENNPIYASFYGVEGSVEIRDAIHGRDIMIEVRFNGYINEAALETAANLVDSKVGQLNDSTLIVAGLVSTIQYPHCTFAGLIPQSRMQVDGSGTNGWFQDFVLKFRQLKRTP